MTASAYVVYPPPVKGLPFLSVMLMPDGTVVARQFDTESSAEEYTRQMAKGGERKGSRH